MSSFNVVPAELDFAGASLHAAATQAGDARSAAASAAGASGAFGGQPAGAAYADACAWARAAADEVARALGSLGTCVSAAARGYLVTDEGVVPAASVPGAVGTSDSAVSTLIPINPAAFTGPMGWLAPEPPPGMMTPGMSRLTQEPPRGS